jgi:aminocarboxymuconate-semialdehyde decarboxylase
VFPLFDLHAHFVAPALLDVVRADGGAHNVLHAYDAQQRSWLSTAGRSTNTPVSPALSDAGARLQWMDANGIATQLLSGWMDFSAYNLAPGDARWFARAQNETLAAVVAGHPGRFLSAAAVPLQDADAAADELEYAVKVLGARAVQIGASVDGKTLDDPAFDPFWAKVSELGVPVVIHPVDVGGAAHDKRHFMHITFGNPAATTAAAAALILSGTLERFPRLRFLLVHGGGFLPYQFSRFERSYTAAPPNFKPAIPHPPSHYIDRFYFDTMIHDSNAMALLGAFAGPERIVFGSDAPFPMGVVDPPATLAMLAEVLGPDTPARLHAGAISFLNCGCPASV